MHTHSLTGRSAVLVLAALTLAVPAAAQTAEPVLTLEAAVAAARQNNPDMQAQRNEAISARAGTRAARADFLPSAHAQAGFGYTAPGVQRFGSEVFGTRPEYYSSNYQLGLSYSLSGAKLMQPSIARANETATEARIVGAEADLVSRVAQQYLTVLQAREHAEQAVREVERAQEHQRLAEARLNVGAGTPLDVRRAEVQLGQAQVQQVQRENNYRTEMLRLGQLMGTRIPEGTRLEDGFTLDAPRWEAESLVQSAIANNPVIQARRAQTAAAQGQVRAARSQYLPTMNASVGLTGSVYSAGNLDPLIQQEMEGLGRSFASCLDQNQIRNAVGVTPLDCARFDPADPAVAQAVREEIAAGNPAFPFGYQRQPVTASITFSLPLFDGLARERRVEEARVAASNAQLQVTAEEQRIATEVRAATLALQTAFRTVELQRQVAANAAEELRMAQERFRYGLANSIEVTDAQANLAEAERAVIDAVYAYHKALAGLQALVGQPLDRS